MTFQQKLDAIVDKNNSLLCIGLDSDFDKLPDHLKSSENPQYEFNKEIIETTYDFVCAYKPNTAFYEARGEQGISELKMTTDYLRQNHPDIPIILDAKRADIGNTNKGYIDFAFKYLWSDAITLHPYLGSEAIQPFLDLDDKGIIILCKTSNPGAAELQDLILGEEKLYKIIAKKVATEWNKNKNCLLVVGATYPEVLAEIRKIVGEMSLLVPGVGAQGGNIESVIKAGINSRNTGLIINASRSIIFASSSADFAEKARAEAIKLKDEINLYRK